MGIAATSASQTESSFFNKIGDIRDKIYNYFVNFEFLNTDPKFVFLIFCILKASFTELHTFLPVLGVPLIPHAWGTVFFCITLCLDIAKNLYDSKELVKEGNYAEVFEKVIPSFIQVVGIFYVFSIFFFGSFNNGFFQPLDIFTGTLFIGYNIYSLFKNKPETTKELLFRLFPILLMSFYLVYIILPSHYFSSIYMFGEIASDFAFVPIVFCGMYDYKNSKILNGTFDTNAWQKYLVAFCIQAVLIFLGNLTPDFFLSACSIPFGSYLGYVLLAIPLCFNQTLAEEYIFRSIVYKTKDKLDKYNISFGILCLLCSLVFILCHTYQHSGHANFLALTFSTHLGMTLAFMGLTLISGGVEYSAGTHFANNFIIKLCVPIAAISAGHIIHFNFMVNDLPINFILSSIELLLVFLPILVAEYFFRPKSKPCLNLSSNSGSVKEFSFENNKLGQVSSPSGNDLNTNVGKEYCNV